MSPDTVVLVGNPRPASRTRLVAERLVAQLGERCSAVLELAEVIGVTFSATPANAIAPDESAFARVSAADLLVVASPSYKGTYTGLLKIFFEQLPHAALTGVIAVPVAVAGSPDHARSTAEDLTRLLRELGAVVPASAAVTEPDLSDFDLSEVVASVSDALGAGRPAPRSEH